MSQVLQQEFDGTPADLQNSGEEEESAENDVTDLEGLVEGLEEVLAQQQLSPAQKQALEEAEKTLLTLLERDPADSSSTYTHQEAYTADPKYYNGFNDGERYQ